MMDKDKITADWANKTATQILGDKVQEQVNKCLHSIENSVNNNEFSTGLSIYLHDRAKKELERRGFKVNTTSDQRDGDYTTISW